MEGERNGEERLTQSKRGTERKFTKESGELYLGERERNSNEAMKDAKMKWNIWQKKRYRRSLFYQR